jgi:hypothetical protein
MNKTNTLAKQLKASNSLDRASLDVIACQEMVDKAMMRGCKPEVMNLLQTALVKAVALRSAAAVAYTQAIANHNAMVSK